MSDALDGKLSPVKRALLRMHLWLCGHCRSLDDSLRFTHSVLHKMAGHAAEPHSDSDPAPKP